VKINIETILSDTFKESFIIKESGIFGIPCILINPNPETAWNKENIVFRSSIWDKQGNLLSAGFKKFVNIFEKPDVFTPPNNLDKTNILNKIDGSCMICDLINGELSVRTRGTFSYKTLDNAKDFEFAINKYPQIKEFLQEKPSCTILFEIVTPNNKIIIDYGKDIEIYLIGCIDKAGYTLLSQYTLDKIAQFYGFKRPERISANSLDELISAIKNTNGIEGCCLYTDNDQHIFKIKSDYWLKLHALKEDLGSLSKIIKLYFSLEDRSLESLKKSIELSLDFECLSFCSDNLYQLEKLINSAQEKYMDILLFIKNNNLAKIPRKEAAKIILENDKEFSGFYFNVLDGKIYQSMEEKLLNKILENVK